MFTRLRSVVFRWLLTAEERAAEDILTKRPPTSDEEIAEEFYPDEAERQTALRVMQLYRIQLHLSNIRPIDCFHTFYDDVDFSEFLDEVDDHFGVKIDRSRDLLSQGTVDYIIKSVMRARPILGDGGNTARRRGSADE